MVSLSTAALLQLLVCLAFAAFFAKALLARWRDAATAARATHALRTSAALVLALACALHLAQPGGVGAWLMALTGVIVACGSVLAGLFARRAEGKARVASAG